VRYERIKKVYAMALPTGRTLATAGKVEKVDVLHCILGASCKERRHGLSILFQDEVCRIGVVESRYGWLGQGKRD
jgi:hypothetical protein